MAELISPEYRIKTAIDRKTRQWVAGGVLTVILSVSSLTCAYVWKQHRSAEFAALNAQFHTKAVLIDEAKSLQSRRVDLADRMTKMQQLMEDKTLLSLLQNIANGFSANDCLDYISVDAHGGLEKTGDGKKPVNNKYSVRITGITATDATHADLLNRLTEIGKASDPPISINPESLRRETLYDGQVFRFQILCEQPLAKGG